MAAVTSAVAAVGGLAVSAYGAKKQASAANRSANAQEAASAAQADLLDSQRDIGEQQWQQYKDTYLPLEKKLADRVQDGNYAQFDKTFESDRLSEFDDNMLLDAQKEAANAGASVAANFQQARHQLASTPGLDPTSQQYLREANRLNMQEAASTAAAENVARTGANTANFQSTVALKQLNDDVNQKNYQRDLTGYGILRDNFNLNQTLKSKEDALLLDAISVGRGVAGSATGAIGSALSAQTNALSSATSQANTAQSNFNSSLGGLGTALGTTVGAIQGAFGQSSQIATTPTVTPSHQLGSYNYSLSSGGSGPGLKF